MLLVTISHAGNANKEKIRFVKEEKQSKAQPQEVEVEPVKIDSVQAALGDMRTRWGNFAIVH